MTEMTPGGSQVFRHRQPIPQGSPIYDERLRSAIKQHLAPVMPGEPRVLHEIVSSGVHLDVSIYPPGPDREFHTLVTMGMSERPMPARDGGREDSRCELVMALPPDWPLPDDPAEFQRVMSDERSYWPIRVLKQTARLPHDYGTWISYGHTVAAGEDAVTYEGSEFAGVMLGWALTLGPERAFLEHEGKHISFWGLYPLYADEMEYKLKAGAEAVFDRLDWPEGAWPGRPSVAPRKRRLFRR